MRKTEESANQDQTHDPCDACPPPRSATRFIRYPRYTSSSPKAARIQRSPTISSANLKFPWTAEKLDRSGGFPRRRVRSGCLPKRSKSSKPTPHATPSRRVVAQLRYRLNPTCFHGTPRTRNEIHASRKRYGVALTFRM